MWRLSWGGGAEPWCAAGLLAAETPYGRPLSGLPTLLSQKLAQALHLGSVSAHGVRLRLSRRFLSLRHIRGGPDVVYSRAPGKDVAVMKPEVGSAHGPRAGRAADPGQPSGEAGDGSRVLPPYALQPAHRV